MTDDRMALKALLYKSSDSELLAEMIGFVANRLMALDAEVLCNAKAYERSAERANHRNGYRDRAWQTRAGRIDLKQRFLVIGNLPWQPKSIDASASAE